MALFTSPEFSCRQSHLSDWHFRRTAKTKRSGRAERSHAASNSTLTNTNFQRLGTLLCLLLATLALILAVRATARGQNDNKVVAIVNGRSITQNEVDRLVVAQTLPLEQKLYAIRKAALENLITLSLLESEAEKRGLTVAELRKQLASGEVRVTANQVEDAYAANATFFGSMSPDEAKERLRLDLENQQRMQNYRTGLAELKQNSTINLRLTEPPRSTGSDETAAPSMGPKNAPVTIVEFSDFECLYCRTAQSTIKQLLQTFEKEIRLVFKHLPLESHQHAFPAAQAAFCAGQQGLFWQYHDALFAAETLTSESFNTIARNVGLKVPQFNRCLASDSSRNAVFFDMREASQLGINSTPTFMINGQLISGAISLEEFKAIVEQELRSARNSGNQQPLPARKE
jgi:protein-disulfide isomerase/Skp family chaperone for outer membrane proteins